MGSSQQKSHISLLSLILDPASVSVNSGEAITDVCNKNYFAEAVFQASVITTFDRDLPGTGNSCIPLKSSNPAELGKLALFTNTNS